MDSVSKQAVLGAVEQPIDTKNGQPAAKPPSGSQTTPQTASPLPNRAVEAPVHTTDQPKEQSIWTQGIPGAIVSILAATCSVYYFYKNRKLSSDNADRTVTFEAQKLLLEINKQFIADPSLFAIYDDNPQNKEALKINPQLKAKVEALGYMKLNVYEIVFAKLPDDSGAGAWKAYFLDSLDRCSVLAEELKASKAIYHPRLLKEYEEWVTDTQGRDSRAAVRKQQNSGSKAACLGSTHGNGTPQETAKAETVKGSGT